MSKKQKKTVALKYEPDQDRAPRIVAKGTGPVADKILELAREHGIPVKDDPDLVEVLSRLDIQEQIPAELYVIVAELLAFVYKLNGKRGVSESQ
jgi:flagellar biosynthesis protein